MFLLPEKGSCTSTVVCPKTRVPKGKTINYYSTRFLLLQDSYHYSTVSLKFYLDSTIHAKFIVKHPSDLKYSFCKGKLYCNGNSKNNHTALIIIKTQRDESVSLQVEDEEKNKQLSIAKDLSSVPFWGNTTNKFLYRSVIMEILEAFLYCKESP